MTAFRVDAYIGTDTQRLNAAYNAAFAARPATVMLPDRELRLTGKRDFRPGVSVSVEGPDAAVFLDFPGATAPAGNSPYGFGIVRAPNDPLLLSTFEGFAIRGRPTGYYRLIHGLNTRAFELRELAWGVCGQSFVELRGCSDVLVWNCVGAYGGDKSYDGASAKYKVALVNCDTIDLDDLTLGDPAHDRNQSFVTINASHHVTVRDSTFYGTRTYCLNTHGTGSTGVVFQGNHLEPGSAAKFGAVLVGNEAWGADLDVAVRDNVMVGEGRFLQLRAGSTVNMEGNIVPPCNELVGFGPGGGTARISG